MSDNPWDVDSGLVSDYEGTVIDAWFGIDTAYNPNTTLLFLKMATDSEKVAEVTERYSCGPDWTTIDGGATVGHGAGRTNFNARTQIGKLISKAVELAGESLTGRGAPSTAATWLGTKWYMEEVASAGFKNRVTGEDVPGSSKNYPSKFLGIGDVATTTGTGTGTTASNGAREVDPGLRSTLSAMAKLLPHAEWVDKVLEVDGVLKDEKLISQLPDTSPTGLYERLKSE